MNDKYEEVTAAILAQLEKGVAPWRKPWSALTAGPRNAFSKRAYRGINVWLLLTSPFEDPRWATFNQIRQAGGMVRRGEKGQGIYFFKPLSVKDTRDGREGKMRTIPLLQHFTVFNVAQADGLTLPPLDEPTFERSPIEAAEAIIENMPQRPTILWDGNGRAFFRPSTDEIHLPPRDTFESDEAVYATLFHEITHSTGSKSRLDRDTVREALHFGDEMYGREELIAEMGSSFLAAESGLTTTLENSANYLSHWMKAIKEDKRMIVVAAGAAQKAADFILDRKVSE